jgi:hypothetical protein
MSIKELAAKMEFSTRPAPKQGIKPNQWTVIENDLMRKHYANVGPAGMLDKLTRSHKAIRLQAARLGLVFRYQPTWLPEQEQAVRDHYRAKGGEAVAKMIGRSVFAVRRMASRLGIKADMSRHGRGKAKQEKIARIKKEKVGIVLPKSRGAQKPVPELQGEAIITPKTIITIAPPFVDTRWIPEKVTRVVDSSQCRAWATQVR